MIERLHKSVIGLDKNYAIYFKKELHILSKPAALDTLLFFKIVKMVLSETVAARIKESP